eukprot:TRINITY_DN53_c0_g1_i1.p1 TRINITY_DN53_c0_g1~~TRINITY_DN53_c0_g1_i1.p1  ORF type:complete len:486 (-),score=122.06 TRINITY_DN53_c0_g1_i1:89-1507(-)
MAASYDTATEQQYYAKLYTIADTDHDGKVNGAEGASFLRKASLPDAILEKVWDMADANRQGFLKEREFAIAMRLVALAQEGKPVTLNQIPNVSSYPKFDTIPPPPPAFPTRISDDDLFKFDNLFVQADQDQDGFVNGQEARTYFTKAKIPTDKLAAIWELSERDGDGKLNRGEFRVAMTLMYWLLRGNDLPQAVPSAFVTYAASAASSVQGPTPVVKASQPPPVVNQLTTQAPIQPTPPLNQQGMGYGQQPHPSVTYTQGQIPISQVPQGQVTISQGMPPHQPMPVTYLQPGMMQPGMVQPGMVQMQPGMVQPGMVQMGYVQGAQMSYVAPVSGALPVGYVVSGPAVPIPINSQQQFQQQQMHQQQQMQPSTSPRGPNQVYQQQQMQPSTSPRGPNQVYQSGQPQPSTMQPVAVQLPSGYPQPFAPAPAQNTFTETSANTIHKYTLPGASFEQRVNLTSELNSAINRRKPSQ